MRTTLDIPEELLDEARRAASLTTKRETVISALQELVKKAKREQLRQLAGRMNLRIDLARSRRRKTTF